jgi:hypothetical protein
MIRIAAIGCGGWGKNLVRNLAALDVLAHRMRRGRWPLIWAWRTVLI